MKLQSKVKLLAVPAVIINSMLISMGTAQANSPRGFTQTCTDIDAHKGTLSAKCRRIDRRYRTSSIDLNSYIANHNGVLVWSRKGNYVDTTNNCQTYTVTPYTSNLTPLSYHSCDARTIDGQNSYGTVTLDEHIENVDGQLQYFE